MHWGDLSLKCHSCSKDTCYANSAVLVSQLGAWMFSELSYCEYIIPHAAPHGLASFAFSQM